MDMYVVDDFSDLNFNVLGFFLSSGVLDYDAYDCRKEWLIDKNSLMKGIGGNITTIIKDKGLIKVYSHLDFFENPGLEQDKYPHFMTTPEEMVNIL